MFIELMKKIWDLTPLARLARIEALCILILEKEEELKQNSFSLDNDMDNEL